MDTTAATPSRITTTMRAFPLVAYFALAYALSWLILVPAGLGLLPESSAGVLSTLVPFGPAVAAFTVAAIVLVVATRGRLGYRAQRVPLEPTVRS